jgi:hypothetical protein
VTEQRDGVAAEVEHGPAAGQRHLGALAEDLDGTGAEEALPFRGTGDEVSHRVGEQGGGIDRRGVGEY